MKAIVAVYSKGESKMAFSFVCELSVIPEKCQDYMVWLCEGKLPKLADILENIAKANDATLIEVEFREV